MKFNVKNPLFILAAGVLLVTGSLVTATRASGSGTPKTESVEFKTAHLSVELQEKQSGDYVKIQETRDEDGAIDSDKLGKLAFTSLADVNEGKEMPKPGTEYDEDVQVKNNGDCDEYVRAVVYKSWLDADSNKVTDLDSSIIELNLANSTDWIAVSDSDECTTYYYKKALKSGETTKLIDSVSFGKSILNSEVKATKDDKGGIQTDVVYAYNGKKLQVEMRVDAVQTHSAEDAILGAWGVVVALDSEGNITGVEE